MSIHDHKTPATIVAELKMTRTKLPSGSFLLLEGPDDKRFWNRWIESRACSAIISGGKNTLLGAVRRLDAAGFRGALGVADADLDRLHCMPCPSPNLAWTHAHDLEAMLVQMGAARAVVQELDDADRLAAFERHTGTTLEDALLQRALAFGRIRCAQALTEPSPELSWLKVPRFLDEEWSLRTADLERAAVDAGLGPTLHALEPWLGAHQAHAPWDLVHGHDLVDLLTEGLRRALGSLPGNRGRADVARALRLAVDSADLRQAPLYGAVRAWEQAHAPYEILRPLS